MGPRAWALFASGALAALGTGAAGCVVSRQMLASSDDLADYRLYRTAAHEGRRLFEAQRYLERHPHGAFAGEVRAAFDVEEPAWFEGCKTSRARAKEYVVDLPSGPHAEAARALLLLFDEHQEDSETLTLLSEARRTAATLDYETGRRHRVGDLVLGELGALLDPATWGARLDAPPAPLAAVLRGAVPTTWGAERRPLRKDDLFFVVPTPRGSQSREASVAFRLWTSAGRVSEGAIAGEDLFVRWSEAELVRVLDANDPSDRALAAATVRDMLSGALEATLPASRCTARAAAGDVLDRACGGWSVTVHMGSAAGAGDTIDVHGPSPHDDESP